MIASVYKSGKHLRYGYTTGSCAAAASKAAAYMLRHQEPIDLVELMTPKGWLLKLNLVDVKIHKDKVSCAIIKDSGDDPDITNGVKVYSEVSYHETTLIKGGLGVGQVTKKGLSVEIGQPAINPVPRKMILEAVESVMDKPVLIEISVPAGLEIAKKTFNPRLGIVGGISIIGTTGIVEPMSEEAFKESLNIELKTIDQENLVMAPGNYGRDYCVDHGIEEKKILKISNFVGYMFDRAVEQKKKKILFAGHIGKLIKVYGGIFHTHSRVSDVRMDLLVSSLVKINVDYKHLKYIQGCNTTEEAVNYIVDKKLNIVFQVIVDGIKSRLELYTFDAIEVEVIMFSLDQGFLGETSGARKMMEDLSE